jgi:hypothetical protein
LWHEEMTGLTCASGSDDHYVSLDISRDAEDCGLRNAVLHLTKKVRQSWQAVDLEIQSTLFSQLNVGIVSSWCQWSNRKARESMCCLCRSRIASWESSPSDSDFCQRGQGFVRSINGRPGATILHQRSLHQFTQSQETLKKVERNKGSWKLGGSTRRTEIPISSTATCESWNQSSLCLRRNHLDLDLCFELYVAS